MKILLLTDIPPTLDLTAGIFLENMLKYIPKENIVCFTVLNKSLNPKPSDYATSIPLEIVPKPRENWGARFGGNILSFVMEPLVATFEIPSVAKKIVRFAKIHKVDRIWVTLQGQSMIRLAYLVSQMTDIPIYSQVYDPPQWWMRANRVNSCVANSVFDLFGRTLQKSKKCALASWSMVEYYEALYGVHGIPMVSCTDISLGKPPANCFTSDHEFSICMAGQLYASAEWLALLSALDQLNWKLNGKNVVVRYMGEWLQIGAKTPRHIEYLGWRTPGEVIIVASESDLCYCPYWFDPVFELEARLSFPSKLPLYFSSGRPVLFHGPSYASPYKFLQLHDAAFTCESLDPMIIGKKLIEISSKPIEYANISVNAHAALQKELSNVQLQQRVIEFLDLEAS
jgi:hypothetical protein